MEGAENSKEHKKLWGGRFHQRSSAAMTSFNNSISVDMRLWKADIKGSKVYAGALQNAGLLSQSELTSIVSGLESVEQEWSEGRFFLHPDDEDIHSANERRLTELIGATGGKLHTGRSRNDQVATDVRLWLSEELTSIVLNLLNLLKALADEAEKNIHIILPGYTHLQRAQPVRWGHFLMSHASAFLRDLKKLYQLKQEVEVLPLGSGALAGNPFQIDRELMAQKLGFPRVTPNSIDAVSDRDFIAQFLFWSSLFGIHLSRFAEDLIIYSTKEFGYVTLSDQFSTGSSLMPQKKNPDSLELLRGKSGRLAGNCSGFLITMKGLPSAYNKDLQEDKEALFDSVDQVQMMLQVAEGVIRTITVNEDACKAALSPDMLATDVAYYLIRKGIPFREAHHQTGALVKRAEEKGCQLNELTIETFREVNEVFEEDITAIWDYEKSVEQYKVAGGTAKESVKEQIRFLRELLTALPKPST